MEGRTKNGNKARLFVVAVFIIGVAAGALSMNLYLKPTSREQRRRPDMLSKMSEELGLTADQKSRIDAIIKETFGQYNKIKDDAEPCFKEIKPRFDAVREAGREKMRAVLSEEQLPKFEQMVRQQDARREKDRENRNREHKKSE